MDVKEIGHRIKKLREAADLTQEEAAGLAKIHTRALQRLEAGQGNPTLNTLLAVASALKLDPIELYSERSPGQKRGVEELKFSDAMGVLKSYEQAPIVRRLSALFLLSKDDKFLEQMRLLPNAGPLALLLSKVPKAL